MDPQTLSFIIEYDRDEDTEFGNSVVSFDQYLQVAVITKRYKAGNTIIWKKIAESWK